MAQQLNLGSAGTVPRVSTPLAVKRIFQKYEDRCKRYLWTDADGKPGKDKYGNPIFLCDEDLTVSGTASELGFISAEAMKSFSRQDVSNLTRHESELVLAVRTILLRVQNIYEQRLADPKTSAGAKFVLQTYFGWHEDKRDEGVRQVPVITIINDLPAPERPLRDDTPVPDEEDEGHEKEANAVDEEGFDIDG